MNMFKLQEVAHVMDVKVRLDFELRQGPLSEQAHGMRHEMIILHVRLTRSMVHPPTNAILSRPLVHYILVKVTE